MAIGIPMGGRYSPWACIGIDLERNGTSVQIIQGACNLLFLSVLDAHVKICMLMHDDVRTDYPFIDLNFCYKCESFVNELKYVGYVERLRGNDHGDSGQPG